MKYIKINNFLHRYLGFFFIGAILVYAISGIALNHSDIWNPSFTIDKTEMKLNLSTDTSKISKELIQTQLAAYNKNDDFLIFDYPSSSKIKLYFKNGSMLYDLKTNSGVLEEANRRPFFFQINTLHFGKNLAWKIFSDFFAVSLIIVAVSGFFVRGKKDWINKSTWITVATGIVIPVIYIAVFI
jgi:uncharacterized protein